MYNFNCKFCNKIFTRSQNDKRFRYKFCSHACRYKFYSNVLPKRNPEGECKDCNKPISSRHVRCGDCRLKARSYGYCVGPLTLLGTLRGYPYQVNARIRTMARKVYFAIKKNTKCEKCGYSLHIDVCHIKDISSFSDEAKICEVNDPDNLIGLCKRCHWEFDKKFITLDEIKTSIFFIHLIHAAVDQQQESPGLEPGQCECNSHPRYHS